MNKEILVTDLLLCAAQLGLTVQQMKWKMITLANALQSPSVKFKDDVRIGEWGTAECYFNGVKSTKRYFKTRKGNYLPELN